MLCFLSASLLVLSFPNFNLWFTAWFGLVPLFIALKDKSFSRAFCLAYFTGVVFWSGAVYWLVHVTIIGTIVLVLYLALYFGLFGIMVSRFCLAKNRFFATSHFLLIPSIWVLLEYIRSHLFTGFGWALLGYSQSSNLAVIQIADVSGVLGVSFLVAMSNVSIYAVFFDPSFRIPGESYKSRKIKFVIPIAILVLSLGYGYFRLYQGYYSPGGQQLKVSIIQPSIPQELKWDPLYKRFILDKYFRITREASIKRPQLIVWPEAALPCVLEEEPEYFEQVRMLVAEINTPLLLGAVTLRDERYYNSAILVSPGANTLTRYDKLHLVPFGEFIPFRDIFPWLAAIAPIGDIEPGKEYTIFYLPKTETTSAVKFADNHKGDDFQYKFAVLDCFEDLFPVLSRQFVKRGATFLVNITNDAWYKQTSAPYQHLQASIFRAVENRVPVVRSTNTGVSGFIAPSGKIISLVADKSGKNLFIEGYDTRELYLSCRRRIGFYTRFGDLLVIACFSILCIELILRLRKRHV